MRGMVTDAALARVSVGAAAAAAEAVALVTAIGITTSTVAENAAEVQAGDTMAALAKAAGGAPAEVQGEPGVQGL